MGATYKYYKCVHCKGIAKEKRTFDGLEFGNPFYGCKKCGKLNYDKDIVEAALLSPEEFIKAEKSRWNTGIFLSLYFGFACFLAVSLLMDGFHWGAFLVGIPLAGLLAFLMWKRSKVNADGYKDEIQKSMTRLEKNSEYAYLVISVQKIGRNSAWDNKYRSMTETNGT